MSGKKTTVIISAALTMLGITAFTILQFRIYRFWIIYENDYKNECLVQLKQYGMTISSGIFTSAFVTFLIARSDYLYGRLKSLEKIYLVSEDLQRVFGKIKYIFPDEPKELVRDLFCEIDRNNWFEEYNRNLWEQISKTEDSGKKTNLYEKYHIPISCDAKKNFIDYIWEHTKDEIKVQYSEPHMKKVYLDSMYKKKIEKYSQQLETAMRSYVLFNEVRTNELSSAYGDLDFIFANKSIRQHIYEKLYRKQVDQVNLIKETNFHFNLFFEGKGGSRAVMLDLVWKLQDSLTSEDEEFYYLQYMYDVNYEIAQVLVYANGKANENEYPSKRHYIITTKSGYVKKAS